MVTGPADNPLVFARIVIFSAIELELYAIALVAAVPSHNSIIYQLPEQPNEDELYR